MLSFILELKSNHRVNQAHSDLITYVVCINASGISICHSNNSLVTLKQLPLYNNNCDNSTNILLVRSLCWYASIAKNRRSSERDSPRESARKITPNVFRYNACKIIAETRKHHVSLFIYNKNPEISGGVAGGIQKVSFVIAHVWRVSDSSDICEILWTNFFLTH